MKFKPGQQIVCKDKRKWKNVHQQDVTHGPAFNEIVTVENYSPNWKGYIRLKEYRFNPITGNRTSWWEGDFEPLITDSQLEKELETIEQFV